MGIATELFRFRNYVVSSIVRDFTLRYRGALGGIALIFFAPAIQIAIYVIVFGNLLKGHLSNIESPYAYSIFLCTGIVFWNFFTELLQAIQGLFLENANLLKKASFPFVVLPVVKLATSTINLLLPLAFIVFFVVAATNVSASNFWYLIIVWFMLSALALSMGMCLCILQVFFRDFRLLTPFALQGLFWCTPIIYPEEVLPIWVIKLMPFNPLYAPFLTAQSAVLDMHIPSLEAWISTLIFITVIAFGAHHLYKKNRADMLDNI